MTPSAAESLARRLVVGLDGPRLKESERAWLERWRPAGVILFARNVLDREQLTGLCSQLHALDPGLETVADHEGGPVSQLEAAVGRPPAALTLGTLDDEDLTRRVHRETGRRCRAVGIDRVLAPCCDVLTELRNPVIGSRSFGSDAGRVARQAAAAARGLIDGGVGVCAKHWPGHGGSRNDSHLGLARVGDGARPEPFAAAAAGGADAVMIGHLLPRSERTDERPASLDPQEIAAAAGCGERSLRTYADDVTMGALRAFLGGPAAAAGATSFAAGMLDPAGLPREWLGEVALGGCDRLLIRGIPWVAFPADAAAPVSGAGPVGEAASRLLFDDADYDEARRRAGRAAGLPRFAALAEDLLWLDLTEGDRWQGPSAARERDSLLGRLGEHFRSIRRAGPGEVGAEIRSSRLLVTSHRPWPQDLDLRTGPEAGRCLAMGHPSLATDLACRLPGGWTVSALSDCTTADYSF